MRGGVPALRRSMQGDVDVSSFEESPRYYGYSSAIGDQASAFLSAVYMWMGAGLAITAGTAWYVASSPSLTAAIVTNRGVFWFLAIVQLGIVFVLSARVQKLAGSTAAVLFVIYSALTGATLSVLLLAYTGQSVATTFVVLRARLDEIRDTTWTELIKTQPQQLELLTELASRRTEC